MNNDQPRIVAIIGAGGQGKEVSDLCETIDLEVAGFIVDPEFDTPGKHIHGKPILGGFDWLEKNIRDVSVICAIGTSHERHRLVKRAEKIGSIFINLIHPNVQISRWVSLGRGIIIAAGCILTTDIVINDHVLINYGCTIGHDVVVNRFATISPGVHISGNVNIGEGCYIGTGTNVIEEIALGEWSIIGAGSTIVRYVEPNTTVVGVPGRVIKTREAGWHLSYDEK